MARRKEKAKAIVSKQTKSPVLQPRKSSERVKKPARNFFARQQRIYKHYKDVIDEHITRPGTIESIRNIIEVKYESRKHLTHGITLQTVLQVVGSILISGADWVAENLAQEAGTEPEPELEPEPEPQSETHEEIKQDLVPEDDRFWLKLVGTHGLGDFQEVPGSAPVYLQFEMQRCGQQKLLGTLEGVCYAYFSEHYPGILADLKWRSVSSSELNIYAKICLGLGVDDMPLTECAQRDRSFEDLFVNLQQVRHIPVHRHIVSLHTFASMVDHGVHMAEIFGNDKAVQLLRPWYEKLAEMASSASRHIRKTRKSIKASFKEQIQTLKKDKDASLAGDMSDEDKELLTSQYYDVKKALKDEKVESLARGISKAYGYKPLEEDLRYLAQLFEYNISSQSEIEDSIESRVNGSFAVDVEIGDLSEGSVDGGTRMAGCTGNSGLDSSSKDVPADPISPSESNDGTIFNTHSENDSQSTLEDSRSVRTTDNDLETRSDIISEDASTGSLKRSYATRSSFGTEQADIEERSEGEATARPIKRQATNSIYNHQEAAEKADNHESIISQHDELIEEHISTKVIDSMEGETRIPEIAASVGCSVENEDSVEDEDSVQSGELAVAVVNEYEQPSTILDATTKTAAAGISSGHREVVVAVAPEEIASTSGQEGTSSNPINVDVENSSNMSQDAATGTTAVGALHGFQEQIAGVSSNVDLAEYGTKKHPFIINDDEFSSSVVPIEDEDEYTAPRIIARTGPYVETGSEYHLDPNTRGFYAYCDRDLALWRCEKQRLTHR